VFSPGRLEFVTISILIAMNWVDKGLQVPSIFSVHVCLSVCHTVHCTNTDYILSLIVPQLLKKFCALLTPRGRYRVH
jgi:hypothetical protein